LPDTRHFGRLAGTGIVVLCVAGAFLYLGGWFSPEALTPARFANGFERVDGIYSGFRLNHAKGVCVNGSFESNGRGTRLSRAVVFTAGRVPVIGRFSLAGGNPYVADGPEMICGLGLLFKPDGEEWRTAMINTPVFGVRTPQGFYDRLFASQPDPKTGKPDPERMAAFLASHPETVRATKIIQSHPASSGFDNSTYYGLNAFWFRDRNGTSTPVRWSMVPEQPFAAADTAVARGDKNYLFGALIVSIHQHPLQWRLIITVGQPNDPTNDATIPWPDTREQVNVGTLTLDQVESEDTSPSPCRTINFDPLVLPEGIAPSDDPLLSARSAVYSQSFTRRAGEKKVPSAVTPSTVGK
jgi:catalase